MKPSTLLPLLPLASLTTADTPCSLTKNPGILNAIGKFCQNQGLVVPSAYAGKGMGGAYDGGSVQISGTPPQWVPQEYCMAQFRGMCGNGRRERRFGRGGCQTWKIHYPTERKAGWGGKKMGGQPAPGKPKGGGPESVTVNL
ncbi:hypothetical protein M409DRAFT_51722 [Zasmidium cellare ATCC 36951]|uniref:Uncharacterized protein n=1 Tax=Zasmidium cellare ATCC 36951 TaxID=1080233 RepID=A0A6A6CS66_ZASCE|nr:uncharacterized protein M409DRAFT_51722 [Zasmidium cellare ATCC 36951]KAF2169931.1 hypothetical protein M409DRAFT_51722 [Zasmidium cellare ATCC 36951]